jgi:hypothetical protein
VAGDWRSDVDEWRSGDRDDRGAPLGGGRQLTAILPNGRTLWLGLDEPIASAAVVDDVARQAEQSARQRARRALTDSRSIQRLARSLGSEIERSEKERLARVEAFRRRIVAGDRTLDEKLSKAREELHSRLDNQLKTDDENVRRFRRRGFWDTVLIATGLPLFALYGNRDNPFGSHNLTLVLSLLIFLMGDEVVEAVFGSDRASSRYAMQDADAWSYLAPVANVLAGWWLLGDRQHTRFVTGISTVPLERVHVDRLAPGGPRYDYTADVDLRPHLAPDHVPDFETFVGVPAVAALRAQRPPTHGYPIRVRIDTPAARVERGALKLSLTARVPAWKKRPYPTILGEVDIAWMVDTRKPTSSPSVG